jgi:acyl-coenzyme A thioesterase PaaI-like protein
LLRNDGCHRKVRSARLPPDAAGEAGVMADGFDPAAFMRAAGTFGHAALLGAHYAAHGPDWAELAMDPDPRFADADGAPAFGPIATLLDMAAGTAVWIQLGRFRPHATLDLRVDRLRPGRPGRTIVARGTCHSIADPLAFVGGLAHDGDLDDPIARLAGTFMMTGRW